MKYLSTLLLLGLFLGIASGETDPKALKQELENMIMSPCCYGSPVGDHESPAATKVRSQISQLISEGKSKQEILDLYVGIYGERILASPKAQGFNVMAYVMPPVIVILAGMFLFAFFNRFKTPVTVAKPVKPENYSANFFKKIEQEMEDLRI